MVKKAKSTPVTPPKKRRVRQPVVKKIGASKRSLFSLRPVLPQLVAIAVCVGLYYAMIKFYLFFQWGFFIYYAIKLLIAFEILSAAKRSLTPPLVAIVLGLAVLFTNCITLNTLMDRDTAWQLCAVGLAGILIALFLELRSRKTK